jgi:hypothetical protein
VSVTSKIKNRNTTTIGNTNLITTTGKTSATYTFIDPENTFDWSKHQQKMSSVQFKTS